MQGKRPALFLDRDGVINIDHGYVYKPENFDFVEGIFELVANANAFGYLVVVVTNQAGIGRGYYTEADFYALTNWMRAQFVARGARIDAVNFCPFHPVHGVGIYKKDSDCRKPGPGMLLQAAKEMDLDLNQSILVGDKISDIQAAVSAGVPHRFLLGTAQHSECAQPVSELAEVTEFIRSMMSDQSAFD